MVCSVFCEKKSSLLMLKFPKSCFIFLNALWEWSDVYCVWYLTYFALFFFPWQTTLLTFYRLSLSLNFVISYLLVSLRELSTPSPTNSRQKPRDLHCTGWVWFLLPWLLLALYFFLLSLPISPPLSLCRFISWDTWEDCPTTVTLVVSLTLMLWSKCVNYTI